MTSDPKDPRHQEQTTFGCGEVFILIMVVVVIGAAIVAILGFRLPQGDLGDVTALLFGAASVAMFVLSFLVAVAAIFGWQELRRTLVDRVAEEMRAAREEMDLEIEARVYAGLSLIVGRLCRDERSLKVNRHDLIDAAILFCRRSVNAFKKMRNPEIERYAVVRNNLAFYLALRGSTADAGYALELVDELEEWAPAYEDRSGTLTVCLVALQYAADRGRRETARKVLSEIKADPRSSQHEKKEAEEILASFPEQPELEMNTSGH